MITVLPSSASQRAEVGELVRHMAALLLLSGLAVPPYPKLTSLSRVLAHVVDDLQEAQRQLDSIHTRHQRVVIERNGDDEEPVVVAESITRQLQRMIARDLKGVKTRLLSVSQQ